MGGGPQSGASPSTVSPITLMLCSGPIRGGAEMRERDGNGGRCGRKRRRDSTCSPCSHPTGGPPVLRSRERVVKAGLWGCWDCLSQRSPLAGSTCWREAAVTCCPQGWLPTSFLGLPGLSGWGGGVPCPGAGSGVSHLASRGPPLEIFRDIRGQINPQEDFPSTTKIQNYIY